MRDEKKAAPAAVAGPSERVAFEMWVRKSTTEVPHRDQYGFYDEPVSEWWKVWQARAAAPTTQAAPRQEAQGPVAWVHDCAALLQNDIELWVDRCPHCGKPRTTAAPVAQGDALPREDFAWLVVQEACDTEPADEDDPECIRILRRDLKSAVLAAFLRHDATHPVAPVAQRDADFEAVRKKLCALQRYSFVLDYDGVVRRVQDRTGKWIEFAAAHELFDPVAVDAARAAKEGGA